jgi:hypothetical protein
VESARSMCSSVMARADLLTVEVLLNVFDGCQPKLTRPSATSYRRDAGHR